LSLAGCGSNNALNPQFQPQINNVTDTFQFQTTAITNVTQTLSYTWATTGTSADVNQACSITGGTAQLQITDSMGKLVLDQSLTVNGTTVTAFGTAGNWTIKIILTNTSGTLNFRVQKH
jgi:hypothetical protein